VIPFYQHRVRTATAARFDCASHHYSIEPGESDSVIERLRRLIAGFYLQLDRSYLDRATIVVNDFKRALTQPSPTIGFAHIQVRDHSLEAPELEVEIERQHDVANRIGTVTHYPGATEPPIFKQLRNRLSYRLRAKPNSIEAIVDRISGSSSRASFGRARLISIWPGSSFTLLRGFMSSFRSL
jgi:hypothetical protein